MRCQRQVVCSTKAKVKVEEEAADEKQSHPIEKKNDILIKVYDTNETMHTDQTGKSPMSPAKATDTRWLPFISTQTPSG